MGVSGEDNKTRLFPLCSPHVCHNDVKQRHAIGGCFKDVRTR